VEELSRVAVILSEMAEVVEPTIRLKVFRDVPGTPPEPGQTCKPRNSRERVAFFDP
jgi:hypothetical protein